MYLIRNPSICETLELKENGTIKAVGEGRNREQRAGFEYCGRRYDFF